MQLAAVCYVDDGQSYLMLHRNKKEHDIQKGKWIGVGGKFEAGETPEACIKREVYEETGLHIENPTLRGLLTLPNFDGKTDWYVFVFVAKNFTGELIDCNEGTLEWVPYQDVLSKPTWQGDLLFVEWLLQNKPFFSATFSYDHDDLTEYDVVFYEDK